MTEFIFGRDADKKTEYMLSKMKESLESGKRAIVIAPEQQALYWDTLIARRMPAGYSFNIETVSFTRLADSVFRRFGGTAKHYITDAEKTMLMWNAMVCAAPHLEVYKNAYREDRYVPVMCSAVSEMKLYGISPDRLDAAADELEEGGDGGMLSPRLRDLSLIFATYDKMLHERYDDPEEIPDALCNVLENHDFFAGTAVFITSFYTLTPKEMKVAGHIFRQCGDAFVTFSMDRGDREMEHMSCVWDYVKEMERLAASAGRKVSLVDCGSSMAAEFEYISKNLWNYGAKPLADKSNRVKIIKCADRYDEAVLCAARIKELVRGGAAYSDIAVTAADFSILEGITDAELERFKVPVYVSGRATLTNQPAMRLLLSACAVAAHGWRREDVTACAQSGLCALSPEQCDALERYTQIWNIRGRKMFCRDGGWNMNPGGYTESFTERSLKLMRLANEARDILIPPLEAFSESFGKSAGDICAAAFRLLCDFDVYNSLRAEASALAEKGDLDKAMEKSQVWDAVCSVLDTVAITVPDALLDASRFGALLRKAADTCTIGTIPDGIDRVTVGSVNAVRLDGVRHLIVLGAKSGEFPRTPDGRDGSFFSDGDRQALRRAGIELAPPSFEKIGQEMFLFRHTVSSPKETLTLLIPADEDGVVRPSSGALQVTSLIGGAEVLDFSTSEGVEAVRSFSAAVRGNTFTSSPLCADYDTVSEDVADKIFGSCLRMTQSRIECYNDCAFKYFCQYVLHLDDGKTAELSPADVGNFVHKILEEFMKASAGESFPLDEGMIISNSDRLVREYVARVCPESSGGRLDYLFRRLNRSVKLFARSLSDEFAQSRFVPYSFETKVGYDDSLPLQPIPLSGGREMSFSGIVDRIDVYRRDGSVYVRVADYKTGAKNFSLEECMRGRNVQLLLYLFALCQSPTNCDFRKKLAPAGEEILPAGAVYFSARPGEAKSDNYVGEGEAENIALGDISRRGIVLDDRDVIDAMDSGIQGRYAPVKLKRDGGYAAASGVADLEEFEKIRLTMREALHRLGERIVGGDAGSIPHKNGSHMPCDYCAERAVCRHGSADIITGGKDNG